jgi:hypothetical protein
LKPEEWQKKRYAFDLSKIKELRDDIDQLWERAIKGWNNGLITRASAKEMVGEPTDQSDQVYKYNATTLLLPAGMTMEEATAGEAGLTLTEEEQEEGIAAQQEGLL